MQVCTTSSSATERAQKLASGTKLGYTTPSTFMRQRFLPVAELSHWQPENVCDLENLGVNVPPCCWKHPLQFAPPRVAYRLHGLCLRKLDAGTVEMRQHKKAKRIGIDVDVEQNMANRILNIDKIVILRKAN